MICAFTGKVERMLERRGIFAVETVFLIASGLIDEGHWYKKSSKLPTVHAMNTAFMKWVISNNRSGWASEKLKTSGASRLDLKTYLRKWFLLYAQRNYQQRSFFIAEHLLKDIRRFENHPFWGRCETKASCCVCTSSGWTSFPFWIK